MKKLLILPLLLLTFNLFSQENWETTFKAGINCSFLSHIAHYSGNRVFLGATGGLEQTYYFDNSIFSVQSGLEYENVGAGTTISVSYGNNPSNSSFSQSNANYLSIPMHFKGMINQRWGALAGATYRFGLNSAEYEKRLGHGDVSIDAGFFYRLEKIRFNLIYQYGLSHPDSGSQMIWSRNRTITFTISKPLVMF